ncbi:MAG TPA: NAD(P)/FAD-dependent oxidoreductase [Solirubrobacterales bacterium]|nr:NAD(P)/FAD-dependent oxidoreductase [Solirubrobacterales bacterium]
MAPSSSNSLPVAVLGAGPAGLTAAYLLAKRGRPVIVFEATSSIGGLAQTVVEDGNRFDLGGHRFFTKSPEVSALWDEILGPEMLVRPRLSRIYWRGRFVEYPLRGTDVIAKVGPVELVRCAASYARARIGRKRPAVSFEDWVTARFGRRLFELFFKTYTEKVWGVSTRELRAEWAAQRINDLSLWGAVRAALPGRHGEGPKSLIEEFRYPRLGPGQMWEEMARRIVEAGGELRLEAPVDGIRMEGERVAAVSAGGEEVAVSAAISSAPLRSAVGMASPSPPAAVAQAAQGLRYRDFVTVALTIDGAPPFPDNWVYVHDPRARVGRIQNFRAWSPWMTPDPRRSCVGLEYFCFEGDELWEMEDEALVALAREEVETLGLVPAERVAGGHVVRVPKAYPIYDAEYAERVTRIRAWLDRIPNLQQIGRNGLHRYNNSDHSMLTAMRAVENLCDGAGHDIWAVNADSAYHEREEPDEQPYLRAPATPAMSEHLAAAQPAPR